MPEKEKEMTKSNQNKAKTTMMQAKSDSTLNEIDIRPLKLFVKSKGSLFSNKAFCQTLLAEKDFLSSDEFLAKLETWLNLLRL